MSFFGVGKADATSSNGSRNPYFEAKSKSEAGRFLLEIVALKLATRQGTYFIVEAKALESNVDACPTGETYSWVCDLLKDLGPLNVKRFLAAASGLDPKSKEANEEIDDKLAELSVGEEQPFSGERVVLRTRHIMTKADRPFTVHDWFPADSDEIVDDTKDLP
jgi:hypothetical protein